MRFSPNVLFFETNNNYTILMSNDREKRIILINLLTVSLSFFQTEKSRFFKLDTESESKWVTRAQN